MSGEGSRWKRRFIWVHSAEHEAVISLPGTTVTAGVRPRSLLRETNPSSCWRCTAKPLPGTCPWLRGATSPKSKSKSQSHTGLVRLYHHIPAQLLQLPNSAFLPPFLAPVVPERTLKPSCGQVIPFWAYFLGTRLKTPIYNEKVGVRPLPELSPNPCRKRLRGTSPAAENLGHGQGLDV